MCSDFNDLMSLCHVHMTSVLEQKRGLSEMSSHATVAEKHISPVMLLFIDAHVGVALEYL